MSAEIINIGGRRPVEATSGNGAREAIRQYFADCGEPPALFFPREDQFLVWLWDRGFKVVPVGT